MTEAPRKTAKMADLLAQMKPEHRRELMTDTGSVGTETDAPRDPETFRDDADSGPPLGKEAR
jgi:hypothetical protein